MTKRVATMGTSDLLITAGLAAAITAAGGFANEFAREAQEPYRRMPAGGFDLAG